MTGASVRRRTGKCQVATPGANNSPPIVRATREPRVCHVCAACLCVRSDSTAPLILPLWHGAAAGPGRAGAACAVGSRSADGSL